jgi:hypothetical protein
LDEQGGCCAICRQPWRACAPAKRARYESTFFQHLCIDHDHRNGNVRGLLCNACNAAIGFFEEDEQRFAEAVSYLRRHGSPPRVHRDRRSQRRREVDRVRNAADSTAGTGADQSR